MEEYGKIILLQNVVFLGDEKAITDSKYFRYRPCIVMGETENEIYVLPISSNYGYVVNTEYNFEIKKEEIEPINGFHFRDLSYVKVNNMLKKTLYYYNDCGYLDRESYYELLQLIKEYIEKLKLNKLNGEIYIEYEEELDRQLKVLGRGKNEIKKRKRS